MIDGIANTMKTLENIVIDYYSELDKSEKLSERQQQRLEILKQKRKDNRQNRRDNRNVNKASDTVQDTRKRGTDVTRLKKNDNAKKKKSTKVMTRKCGMHMLLKQ